MTVVEILGKFAEHMESTGSEKAKYVCQSCSMYILICMVSEAEQGMLSDLVGYLLGH